jgi:hypothetical protein
MSWDLDQTKSVLQKSEALDTVSRQDFKQKANFKEIISMPLHHTINPLVIRHPSFELSGCACIPA